MLAISSKLVAIGSGQTCWLYDLEDTQPAQKVSLSRRGPWDKRMQSIWSHDMQGLFLHSSLAVNGIYVTELAILTLQGMLDSKVSFVQDSTGLTSWWLQSYDSNNAEALAAMT